MRKDRRKAARFQASSRDAIRCRVGQRGSTRATRLDSYTVKTVALRISKEGAWRTLGWLATLAMVGLLAWMAASIFWSLTTPATPQPSVALELDPGRAAQSIAARHPFGEAPALQAGSTSVQHSTPSDIALRGVIAPARKGQAAVAVLAIAGKPPISVREGEEAVPGIVLYRVRAHEVEIKRDGQLQSIALPDRTKAGTEKPPAGTSPARPPGTQERTD
jgi:hypothetical protein